jgi:hypothetical protein
VVEVLVVEVLVEVEVLVVEVLVEVEVPVVEVLVEVEVPVVEVLVEVEVPVVEVLVEVEVPVVEVLVEVEVQQFIVLLGGIKETIGYFPQQLISLKQILFIETRSFLLYKFTGLVLHSCTLNLSPFNILIFSNPKSKLDKYCSTDTCI